MVSIDTLRALLAQVYIHDDDFLDRQCARYSEALESFRSFYGPGPVAFYRAPGRVNLIGEHTDYNQGYVMPTAIDRDVAIVGRPRSDNIVRAVNVEGDKYRAFEFELSDSIPAGPVGHWSNYIRGAAQKLAESTGKRLRGMDMAVAGRPPHGTPIGVGLSSSTSLTVVSMLALIDGNKLQVSDQQFAEMASEAEWYVGTRGGIMDQFASVFGRGGYALFLDCRPIARGKYHLERIPIPGGYRLVVCSTGVRHENTRSEFNVRVMECRISVHMLRRHFPQITHLRDISSDTLGLTASEVESLLEEELPLEITGRELIESGTAEAVAADMPRNFRIDPDRRYRVRQRSRHVVTENQRVIDSVAALRDGDMLRFGELMNEAHRSARDDYEVSVPQVEAMVDAALSRPGCIGARLTGAGWGGCVVAVVDEQAVEDFLMSVSERYRKETGIVPELIVCNSATGAQVVASELILQ